MTVKERLKAFIRYLNISERDFCNSIGVSHAYVSNMKSKINAGTREAIECAYPLLNIEWVLTGRGEMLLDAPKPRVAPSVEKKQEKSENFGGDMVSRLMALVESQQQTISELTENNSRLTRLVEGYKKAPAAAPGIPAPSVVD